MSLSNHSAFRIGLVSCRAMAHTTTGSIMRSNQAYALQVSRAEALEWGVAYTSAQFPALAQANQLREVLLPDGALMPSVFDGVEAHYAANGVRCLRWVPAVDQPYEVIGQFLWERGWRRRDLLACALDHWPEPPASPEIRVLPARPMRGPFRATFSEPDSSVSAEYETQSADSGLERLDEASYEAFVAVRGAEAVGRCALFQVGDIGRVIDLYVGARFRRQGVGRALVAHVLAVAKRLVMRTICVEVEVESAGALRCVEKAGFLPDGTMVEFLHPDAVAPPT